MLQLYHFIEIVHALLYADLCSASDPSGFYIEPEIYSPTFNLISRDGNQKTQK